jgi:hypothetical protein
MRRFLLLLVLSVSSLACDPEASPGREGEGEGEGEGAGEGEGEGDGAGEGEGDGAGEGEGDGAGEGEGDGEGEGEGAGEGEGEGEGPSAACARDGDCEPATVCRFADPDNDGFVIDGRCGAVESGVAPGGACSNGAQCERGVCTNARCSALCESAADCPAGMACQQSSFTVGGAGGVAPICVPDQSLPPQPCIDDDVCADSGRVCNAVVVGDDDDLGLQCGFGGVGAGLGEACASVALENRAVCQSGLCDGADAGICTKACTQTAQCGAGLLCSGPIFSNLDGGFCADPCLTTAQCPTGRRCQLRHNFARTAIDTVCGEPFGALPPGALDAGPQCLSGFALDGRCSELCVGDGDCPAAMPRCVDVDVTNPQGVGTTALRACAAAVP